MGMSLKWLDVKHIHIENGVGAEEIPKEENIGRPYGKSRIKSAGIKAVATGV